MGDTFHNIIYHVVFSTKERRPLITPALQPRLYEYLGGIIRGEGGTLYEIGGTADHVPLPPRSSAFFASLRLIPASTLIATSLRSRKLTMFCR